MRKVRMAKKLDGDEAAIRIAYVIFLMWIVNFVLDLLLEESFEPPVGLHALVMASATFMFGREVFKRDKEGQ